MNYSYIDVASHAGNIITWCRDSEGVLFKEQYDLSKFLCAYIPDNTGNSSMRDMWGNPMKRVSFDDKRSLDTWCAGRLDVCESDVSADYRAIMELFSNADSTSPVHVLFYDIEVDFDLSEGKGYPLPSNPYGEINSFQCYDPQKKRYIMVMNEKFKGKFQVRDPDDKVETRYVPDERALMLEIVDIIDDIDIIAGWNVDGFDLPYIMERAILLFGEKRALTMFCRDGFKANRRDFVDAYGQSVWEWTLVGRSQADMMGFYKKFIPGEKTSFALDAVCEEDLDEKKIEYDGDLGELFRTNPEEFFKYAKQDVRLLKLLNEKHNLIEIAIMLARMSCVRFRDVMGSVKPIEAGFIRFCHEKGIVVPNKSTASKEAFPGAIVYDTIAGLYGWVFTVDLTALYPSCMIMLGLSTETLIAQLSGGYDDYVSVMTGSDSLVEITFESDKHSEYVKASDLLDAIRDSGYCLSANGTLFDGSLGLLSEYVLSRFDLRKHYQREKKRFTEEGDLKNADISDLIQKVMKIVCNSLYGCISNEYFRLFDIRMARSITLTGQVVSKWQAYRSNDIIDQITE